MSQNNENKLVPRLRFPEFRNEEGWEMKKVGEVIEESKVPSTSNNPHNRITVRLNQKGVEKREVRGTEADNATYFFIRRKGQFIYGKQNLHKGAFGLIPDELDGFESSQDIPAFDFKKGYYPQYFVYYLGQENVYPDLEKISTGTGSKRIHPRDLFQVKFPFPKTEEQQKIAACLSSLDDVITAESKKLDVLKEHKKGLLQNLFPQEGETVPKLRFKEFVGNWKDVQLGSLIEIKGRIGYRGYTTNDIVEKGQGAITFSPSNIDDNNQLNFNKATYISWDKYFESPEIMLQDGYTVLVKTGSSFGKAVFIKNLPGKTTINPQLVVLKPININPKFLFLLVCNSAIQRQIKETVVGGAIPTLSQESISRFEILIPPDKNKKEQEKIADTLSSIDDLINAQSQKIETLKLHKKGLLQGLFPDINEHNG